MSAAWDQARDVIAETLKAHLPKDTYDDEAHHAGTYCTGCHWTGDHFGHGFDDHLATAVMDALVINLGLHGIKHTHLDGRASSSLATDHIDEPVLSKETA